MKKSSKCFFTAYITLKNGVRIYARDYEKAIEAWNRRADDGTMNMPDVGMMAEELKKELDKYKIEKENKK